MSKYRSKQSPINASLAQLLRMPRDNKATAAAWALVDGRTVTLATQRASEKSTGSVTMNRKDFIVLARWLLKRVPMKSSPTTNEE